MTTPHRPSDDAGRRPRGPLARSIVTPAGTPDDASDIDTHLPTIARLAAGTLPPVSYASVTAVRDSAYTTVAASSDLAVAVDQAQYAENSGPCLDALHHGAPVGVHDIDTTMAWPGFRQAAARRACTPRCRSRCSPAAAPPSPCSTSTATTPSPWSR